LDICKHNDKKNLLYFNFNTSTCESRKYIRDNLLQKGFIENSKKDWKEYIEELSTYHFCISPPGNGIDCHRHWESIYVGCIPIILRTFGENDPLYYYFRSLPILFVDDYDIISQEFLEEQLVIFQSKNYCLDSMNINYWDKLINTT